MVVKVLEREADALAKRLEIIGSEKKKLEEEEVGKPPTTVRPSRVPPVLCANGCGQPVRKWVQDVPFCGWRCHFEWGFQRAMAQTTAHAERITECPKCGSRALRDDGRLGKSCPLCGKAHIGYAPGVDRPRPKRPRHYIKTSVLAD